MTKEYEKLISKYSKRVERYLNENDFSNTPPQKFQFWIAYIKYCLDSSYTLLNHEVFNKLLSDKILILENSPYQKLYRHFEYKKEKYDKLERLQWN
tara:strand:+ start:873 stop:1160 length:288 start_codon:yes stop_codon:yes gene_type:complete